MTRRDGVALVLAAALTVLAAVAIVWLFDAGWERLPKPVALVLAILLGVALIGSPIYALYRWSEAWLARQKRDGKR